MKYFKIHKGSKNSYTISSPYRERMLELLSALHFRFPEKNLIYSDKYNGYILSVWGNSIRKRIKLIHLIEAKHANANGKRNASQE